MTVNDDLDLPLTVEAAAELVWILSEGEMSLQREGDEVRICVRGRPGGFRLLPYQQTRRGLARAVAEISAEIEGT